MNCGLNYLFLLIFALCASYVSAEEICQSSACKQLSDDLLHRSMNQSVPPCDNFYEYVCGNWPTHNPLTSKEQKLDSFLVREKLVKIEIEHALLNAGLNSSSHAVRYVAQMYSDCVDTDFNKKRGAQPLIESVEQILGAWPMLRNSNKTHPELKQWPVLFVNVNSRTGLSPIFGIKSAFHKLRIQPGPTTLNPNSYIWISKANETFVQNYRNFLHKAALLLGATANEKLTKDIDQLINFERNLLKAANQSYSLPSKETDFHGTISAFQIATHNRVDWLAMLNGMLRENVQAHVQPFNATYVLEAAHVEYINLALDVLNTTPIEVIQNFFAWQIAISYGSLTTSSLGKAILEFKNKKGQTDIFSNCDRLPSNWEYVMVRIYVDSRLSPKERAEAVKMIGEIKSSFRNNLQANNWLDSKTKQYALKKLDAIRENVGYPAWILSDEALDSFYPELARLTAEKGKYFENVLKYRADQMRMVFEDLVVQNRTMIKDLKIWRHNPVSVNAFYNTRDNSITIPAGILQPPFFDEELPFSMNYGGIGAIIGHEYTHGFDSRGAKYDLNGLEKNWWTTETLAKFEEKTRCFQNQYGNIFDPVANMNVSGSRTLEENTADNGGIKESFLAYKTHLAKFGGAKVLPNLKFTSDQLFFVSYANIWCNAITPQWLERNIHRDVHAPNHYRVNVVLGNTPQFAQTFQCPTGSKMNPVHKCSVW